MYNKEIKYILAKIGCGAGKDGCQDAGDVICKHSDIVKNNTYAVITADNSKLKIEAFDNVVNFSHQLAYAVNSAIKNTYFPIIIGGDHTCGIGTWSGVTAQEQDMGLIWIDAHFDLHTPNSSDSGNIHGMSVASLLAVEDNELSHIHFKGQKFKPENIIFIGVRCFESAEQKRAEELGVTIYYAQDVNKNGFKHCLTQAIDTFKNRGLTYGISFDMDSLDTTEITATGTPVDGGVITKDVVDAFESMDLSDLQAFEIVEYNPKLDTENFDDIAHVKTILSIFDKRIKQQYH